MLRPTGGRSPEWTGPERSMSVEQPTSDSSESTTDPRTKRARTEDMTVALRRSGGIYSVRGESGRVYRVDICEPSCSCPDFQRATVERCKHIRRVDIELQYGMVPSPDGRLPSRAMTDGGVETTEQSEAATAPTRRIQGPTDEFDKYGTRTGSEYYRCSNCGREAMRKRDLDDCCPAAQT